MKTLYELVGEEKLQILVNEFYDRVFESDKISTLFKNDKEEIKEKQFLFLTQFLGGPQLYSAKFGHPRMRLRHMPHKINDAAKEEWLKCMKESIDTLDLTDEVKTALFNCFPPVAQHMVNS